MTHRARIVRRICLLALVALPTGAWGVLHQPALDEPPLDEIGLAAKGPVRFAPLDVYIDAGDDRLGAWQVELAPKPEFAGRVSIVGIAGGDMPFAEAPYYDERAIQDERVIIADFETDGLALHTGKSRVAQVQLRIESLDDPTFDITLHTAARHDGAAIDAAVEAILRDPARSTDDNESTDQTTTSENDG